MLEEVLITASSSEEERDDTILQRGSSEWMGYQTPFKKYTNFLKRSTSTPMTVTQMTPSPIRTPTLENTSPTLISGPSTASSRASFLSLKQGYLDSHVSTALFRDPTPSRTRRNQQSFSRSRLSESLLLVDYENPKLPLGMERRRSSASYRKLSLRGSNGNSSPLSSSPDLSSMDSTPDCSPDRNSGGFPRAPSLSQQDLTVSSHQQKSRGRSHLYFWGFLALCISSSLGMVCLTRSVVKLDRVYEVTRPDVPLSAAGLRGQMTSGHWEAKITKHKARKEVDKHRDVNKEKKQAHHHPKTDKYGAQTSPEKLLHSAGRGKERQVQSKENVSAPKMTLPKMHLPPPATLLVGKKFEIQDINMYSLHASNKRRVVTLDPSTMSLDPPRSIKLYPADFTDNTQLYSILDSSDERLSHMEIREPYSDGECVPMQDWQTTFHPSCNGMHEIAMHKMGEDNGNNVNLFGVKGFWRYAWRLDVQNLHEQETLVLKTLKFEHNFEDAHFEHDRVDAVAMERLTSSPHVINVFGFCGHSVLTEYADGSRVGELADKSKKTPLARLKIASDIAHGLADVHGIDGDGNSTFVHLDINPANVVSIGGTLKLNDFNIGIIRRWNTTSNKPCGFPAQYPNPQWRSPEEARNEQNLTEKVDIFSMGHIFFRLICGHEPWNKLEPGGRPSKDEVNIKVQRGDLPFIPDEVQGSDDPEVMAIRDAMLSCYTFDPSQRPSAREIANALDKALEALSLQQ